MKKLPESILYLHFRRSQVETIYAAIRFATEQFGWESPDQMDAAAVIAAVFKHELDFDEQERKWQLEGLDVEPE